MIQNSLDTVLSQNLDNSKVMLRMSFVGKYKLALHKYSFKYPVSIIFVVNRITLCADKIPESIFTVLCHLYDNDL